MAGLWAARRTAGEIPERVRFLQGSARAPASSRLAPMPRRFVDTGKRAGYPNASLTLRAPLSVERKAAPRVAQDSQAPAMEAAVTEDIEIYGDEPLILECGVPLGPIVVRVEGFGRCRPNRACLVLHALTGDAHVARHGAEDRPGWWEAFVGPGRPLDTDSWWVLGMNVLGGSAGTTGPQSLAPDGRPFGRRFPVVTVRDMVRVQARVLDVLEVPRLALAIGGSLGGMQALEWAALYPERVAVAAAIGASDALSPLSVGLNAAQRAAVALGLRHGDPAGGIQAARMLAMLTYRSSTHISARFGRRRQPDGDLAAGPEGVHFAVESYLTYQGDKLARRFDAMTYLLLSRAMDLYDLWAGRDRPDAGIQARLHLAGISHDWLFPPDDIQALAGRLASAGVTVHYEELDSDIGHDAFLIDSPEMRHWLGTVMADVADVCLAEDVS